MEEAMKNLDVPDEQLQAIRSYLQSNVEEKPKAESEYETIILDPDTLQLEDFYIHLKRHMNEMSEERTLLKGYLFAMNTRIIRFIFMQLLKPYR